MLMDENCGATIHNLMNQELFDIKKMAHVSMGL